MAEKDPNRTEKATDKKRNKSRQDGSVPKSQEIGKVWALIGGFLALLLLTGFIAKHLKIIFSWFMSNGPTLQLNEKSVYDMLLMVSSKLAIMLIPYMLIVFTVVLIVQRLQVGPLWTANVFKPKLSQFVNIIGGLKKLMFDVKTMVRLLKSLLSAAAIGLAPYIVLKSKFSILPSLFYLNVEGIAAFILQTGALMVFYALIPMIILSVADLIYTRWDYEENLKMTKDEVKDERKQMEGDPQIKSQQREKMMDVMAMRMLQQVPEADVVITNPTHLAIALAYDALKAPAPLVLAKGAGHMAEKIKEVARENNVPIRENKPLAQALYKAVEVGDIIPEEMYQAVAQILAQLYKHKKPGRQL